LEHLGRSAAEYGLWGAEAIPRVRASHDDGIDLAALQPCERYSCRHTRPLRIVEESACEHDGLVHTKVSLVEAFIDATSAAVDAGFEALRTCHPVTYEGTGGGD
jgi:hypothetical protein